MKTIDFELVGNALDEYFQSILREKKFIVKEFADFIQTLILLSS